MIATKPRASLLILLLVSHAYVIGANRVIATIPVGDSPAGIAITPDGRTAYVANDNNDSLPNGNTVSVLNLTNNTVELTITSTVFQQPYTVTINKAGTKVYVTNSDSSTVSVIDVATNTVIDTIFGFDGPSGFAITPNGNYAYVNNYGGPQGVQSGNGTTVSVVDLATDTIVGPPITVGLAPAGLAITPNGAFVYVINYVDGNPGTGTISIIETSSNTVVGTITGFSGPFQIAITPDGNYAYVTNFGSNNFSPVGTTMMVVNLKTNTIKTTIGLGTQPAGVAIAPNGRFVYVSNYNTLYLGPNYTDLTPGVGTINIIDVHTNKVLPQAFVVGSSPANIAISPNGQRGYVSNYSSNTVSVLNILDQMWLNVA
jgi:YVTN family beta-propeller protein